MSERKIIIGGTYRHPDRFNTEYVVTDTFLWVDGEEETGRIIEAVRYIQTVAGMYPVGTIYARSVDDFLATTSYGGNEVNKFELVEKPSDKPLESQ